MWCALKFSPLRLLSSGLRRFEKERKSDAFGSSAHNEWNYLKFATHNINSPWQVCLFRSVSTVIQAKQKDSKTLRVSIKFGSQRVKCFEICDFSQPVGIFTRTMILFDKFLLLIRRGITLGARGFLREEPRSAISEARSGEERWISRRKKTSGTRVQRYFPHQTPRNRSQWVCTWGWNQNNRHTKIKHNSVQKWNNRPIKITTRFSGSDVRAMGTWARAGKRTDVTRGNPY